MRIIPFTALLILAAGSPATVYAQATCAPNAVNQASIRVSFSGTDGTITWDAPGGGGCPATGYRVSIEYGPNDPPSYYDAPATRSLTIFWSDEQPRWIRVRSVNDFSEGPAVMTSRRFQRVFCTQRPPPPANLHVLSHSAAETELAWNAVSVPNCTTTYLLTAAQGPGGGAGDFQWSTSSTRQSATMPPGVRWYFRVYAKTDAGFSIESQFVSVDPLPEPVPVPPAPNPCPVPAAPHNVALTIAGRTLTIAWDTVTDTCAIDGFWLTGEQYPDGPRLGTVTVAATDRSYTVTFDRPVAFWLRVYIVRGGVLSLPSGAVPVVVP